MPSLTGWTPSTDADAETFRIKVAQIDDDRLPELQFEILKIAKSINYDSKNSQSRRILGAINSTVRQASRDVANSVGDERLGAVRRLRLIKKRARKDRNEQKLSSISLVKTSGSMPTALMVNGTFTSDKEQWRAGVVNFGTNRFRDDTNCFGEQATRLSTLDQISRNEQMDGWQAPALTMFDVVTGRASTKPRTAPGADGGPPEIYLALPYDVVYRIWQAFKDRYSNSSSIDPVTWNVIEFCCLQKTSEPICFDDFRYLGKLDCFAKWYMRSLMPLLRSSLRPSSVATFGFKTGFNCDDVISILMETIAVAHQWGLNLVIGTLDIQIAFDSIKHECLANALIQRGLHPTMVRALLREVSHMTCRITLPGTDPSDSFEMHVGGKQGGVETSELFNAMIEHALEPLVIAWKRDRLGFCFGESDDHPLSHLIWADNITLVAKSMPELQRMAQEITEEIYRIGFKWKHSSLRVPRMRPDCPD